MKARDMIKGKYYKVIYHKSNTFTVFCYKIDDNHIWVNCITKNGKTCTTSGHCNDADLIEEITEEQAHPHLPKNNKNALNLLRRD
jgi:CHAD domain-containing protein